MLSKKSKLDCIKEDNYAKFVQFYDFVVDDKPKEAMDYYNYPFVHDAKGSMKVSYSSITSPRTSVDSEISIKFSELNKLFP